jgi:hypothetical protein
MKRITYVVIISAILLTVHNYRTEIINAANNLLFPPPEIITYDKSEYSSNTDFEYVQITDDFFVNDIQEIKNVYYTVLANGWDKFTFYCDEEYYDCLADISSIASNAEVLNGINNFVHPYNSYMYIETATSTAKNGTISLRVTKTYNEEDMAIINKKVSQILGAEINENMSKKEKMEILHDYIIKNAEYDNSFNPELDINTYKSNTAYGPLLQGQGICGGYTDAMAIFLHELGIKNYKISSENHIWNYVFIDNAWYHIDVTWDDPENYNGVKVRKMYFLIQTPELFENDIEQHTFNSSIYLEAK